MRIKRVEIEQGSVSSRRPTIRVLTGHRTWFGCTISWIALVGDG